MDQKEDLEYMNDTIHFAQRDIPCRLCEANSEKIFEIRNMHRYDITYYRCEKCGSVQTEQPYWLNEAYSNPIRYTDTFAADRAIRMSCLTFFIAKILGISRASPVLDWGGGDGLTTRMLRDLGFDAYSYDMFAQNTYAGGFDDELLRDYSIVTAFEVLEHMADPAKELNELMARKPKVVIMSTCFYSGQDKSWAYFAPYSGRHIFFYTEKAIHGFAKLLSYDCFTVNNLVVLSVSPISKNQQRLLRFALSNKGQMISRVLLSVFPPKGKMLTDWQYMREQVGDCNVKGN